MAKKRGLFKRQSDEQRESEELETLTTRAL